MFIFCNKRLTVILSIKYENIAFGFISDAGVYIDLGKRKEKQRENGTFHRLVTFIIPRIFKMAAVYVGGVPNVILRSTVSF